MSEFILNQVEEKQKQNKGEQQIANPQNQQKTQQQQQNYYAEYCRLYIANVILTTQLKQLNSQKGYLFSKLSRLQKKAQQLSDGNSGQVDQKKRRIRRSAAQIARHYKCNVQGCNKSYGSEGSLNQHLKIKHPQIFNSTGGLIIKQSYQQESS